MKYTKEAAETLFSIKDASRREQVGTWAERIARLLGSSKVTKVNVESALLVASEEFLPDAEQSE